MTEQPLAVGIDFGTSTSAVSVYALGIAQVQADPMSPNTLAAPWTPTLVAVSGDHNGNEDKLALGWEAHSLIESPAAIREVKRALGNPDRRYRLCGQEYRPEEIAGLILHHLCLNAERMLRQPIRDVVLSVPANFGGAAREALLAAAKMAGLNTLRLVNEPTAAALAYTLEHPDTQENLLVFDFGGGTLDITVLRKDRLAIHVRSTHGNPNLGGSDFDKNLRAWMWRRIHEIHGEFEEDAPNLDGIMLSEAEKAKWELSKLLKANVFIGYIGRKNGKGLALNTTITREDFKIAVQSLLDQTRDCLHRALTESGLSATDIGRVLMVGGTVNIPAVQEIVEEGFSRDKCLYRRITTVAEGASYLAADHLGLTQDGQDLTLEDVAGHGLGFRTIIKESQTDMYTSLIAPNTPIPRTVPARTFRLMDSKQKAMEIRLYEGNAAKDCPLDASFSLLKTMSIGDIPVSESGLPHPVTIEFSYNANAVAELRATVLTPGKVLPLTMTHDMRITEQSIEASSSRLRSLWPRTGTGWDGEPISTHIPSPSDYSAPIQQPDPASALSERSQVSGAKDWNAELDQLIEAVEALRKSEVAKMNDGLRVSAEEYLEQARRVRQGSQTAEKQDACAALERIKTRFERLMQ